MENAYIPPGPLAAIRARLPPEDRAIVDVLTGTGYRIDDLLYSRVWQWRGEAVTLTERKTGNKRTVPITAPVRAAIAVINRAALKPGQAERHRLAYLIGSTRQRAPVRCRRKRHRTTIFRHFARAVREAGYTGCGYTVHSLRKVYAHSLYKRTGSILAVQRDLGHKSISTTLLYALGDVVKL